jgi:hypothetical protein
MSDTGAAAHTVTVNKYGKTKSDAARAHHHLAADTKLTDTHFETAGLLPDETVYVDHQAGRVYCHTVDGQPYRTFTVEQWNTEHA